MGIDSTSLEAVLRSQRHVRKRERALTLGRQHIHVDEPTFDKLVRAYGEDPSGAYGAACEPLFERLGFRSTASLDYSDYEGATLLHDLNRPLGAHDTYGFVYDGGTIEHVFNTPQVLENVIDLLEVGGVFCSVTCNNNLSGHGFYQFSPDVFLAAFTPKYGMELLELHLAEIDTAPWQWQDVSEYGDGSGGRNTFNFMSTKLVYIIAVARKITNERASLIGSPPQQHGYAAVSWPRRLA
jgi:hypothetical protein